MGDIERVNVAVTGGTPGGDSNDYKLFDSTVTFGTGVAGDPRNATLAAHDINRIEFSVKNSQAGTLVASYSTDKGTTWTVFDSRSVTAPAANKISGPFDYLVETFPDFKLVWTNGGVAQAPWIPALSLIRGFHGAAT